MKIEFLKENPVFFDAIAEHMFKEWGHLREGVTIARYYNYLEEKLNTNHIPLTIIAKSGANELLGFASLVSSDMETNKDMTPWISGVFVIPEHRGKGIGRLLINRLEQLAHGFGFEKLYLYTFDKEGFYRSLSWEKLKDECYLNNSVSVMVKKI